MSDTIEMQESIETAGPGAEAGPARWWRCHVRLLGAALAAVLAVGSLGAWRLMDHGTDGPTVYYPDVDFGLHPLEPTVTSFTLGSIEISEPGKTVRILSVRPIYSDNLEYLGAFAVWPSDRKTSSLAVGPGFPSDDQPDRHPIGMTVPATETVLGSTAADPTPYPVSISVGFKVRTGDRALVDAVDVTYRAGNEVKHKLFKQAVIACVAPRNCAQPNDESDKAYWAELTHSLHFVQAK